MNESAIPTTRRTRRRPRKIRRTGSEPQNASEEDGGGSETKPEERLLNTDDPQPPESSEPKEETENLAPSDDSKLESSPRRRSRRRPRKLAIRRATEGDDNSPSITAQGMAADAPVDESVTFIGHRVEDINNHLESTTLDVSKLQSGRSGPSGHTGPNLRTIDEAEASHTPRTYSDSEIDMQDDSDSEIEEISRPEPALEQSGATPLVLRGNYEVPLPQGISTHDVRNVQRGAAAAGSIARTITSSFRSSTTSVQETRGAGMLSMGGSWGGLLSQATSLVTGAISAIEMNATVEARGSYRVQRSTYSTTSSSTSTTRSSTYAAPNNSARPAPNNNARPVWNGGQQSSAETVNGGYRAPSTRNRRTGSRRDMAIDRS